MTDETGENQPRSEWNTADYRNKANAVLSEAAGTNRALYGDAMWALDILREQGFVILTGNDTRAYQFAERQRLQDEVDRLTGRLRRLEVPTVFGSSEQP